MNDEFAVVRGLLEQPILLKEEEKRLSQRKDLRVEETISRAEKLAKKTESEEIKERAEKIKKNLRRIKKEARGKLIERNQRLVLNMANKFSKGDRKLVPDLFQAGNIGLLKAVEKFKYGRGTKFSTYAAWWIRQEMQREKPVISSAMQFADFVRERLARFTKISAELTKELKRSPSTKEIAEKMTLKEDTVIFLSNLNQKCISLDCPVEDDPGREPFANFLRLGDDKDLENFFHRHLLEQIFQAYHNQDDVNIIKMRFGLGYQEQKTLQYIADIYNLSKERIRQRQNKFISKTREKIYKECGV